MRFDVWSNGEMSDALRQYTERRLRFALDRFAERVERINVRMEDVNGPRGGLDKQCRLDVIGRNSWRIQAQGWGATFYDAIDGAAARAGRSVARVLTRIMETNREVVV